MKTSYTFNINKNTIVFITNDNSKIYFSYLINDIPGTVDKIIEMRKEKGLLVTRSKKSYIVEIKAHIRLYKLGLFKKHTRDTDLEEPIKKLTNIIYFIIGGIKWK